MHCKKCGAELLDWAKVCVICGTPTSNDSEYSDDLMSDSVESVQQTPSLDSQGFTIIGSPDDSFVQSNKVFPDDFQDSEFAFEQKQHVDYLDKTVSSQKIFPDDFKESTMEHERLDVEGATTKINAVLAGDSLASTQVVGMNSQSTSSLDPIATDSFGTVIVDDSVPDPYEQPQQKKKSPVPAVIAVAGAAAAIAACAFVFVPSLSKVSKPAPTSEIIQKKADSTSVVKQANDKSAAVVVTQKVPVVLPINAEGLNENGSRIPVHVKGTDANKAPVDMSAFVDMEGRGIELLAGNYEVRVIASPISESGTMYSIPEAVLTIVVDAGNKVTIAPEEATLDFEVLSAFDVTDENIELARTWIAQDPQKSELADALVERARSRRDATIAAQRNQSSTTQNNNSTSANTDSNSTSDYNNNYYDQTEEYYEPQTYTEPTNTNTSSSSNTDSGSSSSSSSSDSTGGGEQTNPGGNTGGNTGDNTGDNTGGNTGDNTGGNTGDNTGGNTSDGGNQSSDNTSGSSQQSGSVG